MKNTSTPFIIENKIFLIRGFKVMLDSDLTELYGITTYNLNKAVKRNMSRFPADFMFQLSKEEFKNLIFQFGISSLKHGGKRHLPFVFSEHGVTILNRLFDSKTACDETCPDGTAKTEEDRFQEGLVIFRKKLDIANCDLKCNICYTYIV